ncbi:thymidine phosphorylase [Phaeobacter gallaeciensis]|uniref:Thymidine phosphorylase n=1 Tax=Phaeobacter gallaeciensis TaxID=60890 RepID=A0A1B0ZX26_9RHOB|nr:MULTISPECIES: thymidine phosphorylase [Phaeobacter]MDF1770387.1 thymidine phosphorylase [Pseudophaeobacter sp. bin_em_oilr2.035]MEE2633008.1 thymidine phosphorylase [Pseudomonadota bacterium]ANP38659.1 thymidine phosphorylase [Phaeobacter gallaeciensis]MDE4062200.1 thymidine phosphorylase [Phaeobacter gallaeciensis]MDE4125183.1 thymidine phosphorylase [Phaeobacter gallaeciensis]
MDARAINAALRRGETPGDADLRWFAQGLADGTVSDAQAGAFAMAVCLQGLSTDGRRALTLAMRDSGDVLSWDLDGPVLDKHSTGGVGDCVSLLLAPALAECGAYVPMISGRGLGHTGGTLDKMEAIPGVTTSVSEDRLDGLMRDVGCAIVGATAQIAPADKRLYAIRDVTATVESLDLITASILSKKLAASPDALVLDVKTGSGAFMKSDEEARALARSLVDTANAAGCPTSALITDMNQPLAPALGNALEVAEVMRVLTGDATGPLAEISIALGAVLLVQAGLEKTPEEAAARLSAVLTDGRAAARFEAMVAAMGGPQGFASDWQSVLPEASVIREVTAPQAGYISAIDGEALGLCVVGLGGGRMVESDLVDPAVGLSDLLPLGARVARGTPLVRIHAAREEAADRAAQEVLAAITIADAAPELPPLIHERII